MHDCGTVAIILCRRSQTLSMHNTGYDWENVEAITGFGAGYLVQVVVPGYLQVGSVHVGYLVLLRAKTPSFQKASRDRRCSTEASTCAAGCPLCACA
jgi:hypothetical protein